MSDPPAAYQSPSTVYSDALDSFVRSCDEDDESVRSDHYQDYDEIHELDTTFGRATDCGFDDNGNCHQSVCSSIEPQEYAVDSPTDNSPQVSSHYESVQSYASLSEQSDHDETEENTDELEREDDAFDFPPGFITTLAGAEAQQTRRKSTGSLNLSANSDTLNPSILPTYFFCPLTECIMKDPVITPDGNTYERLAILRYLSLDESDPLTGNPLSHEELRQDKMIQGKIEKSRREAWMRYGMEIDQKDATRAMTAEDLQSSSRVGSESERELETEEELDQSSSYSRESACNMALVNTSSSEEHNDPETYVTSNQNANLIESDFEGILPAHYTARVDTSASSSHQAAANMHGWNTPLGVHQIICQPPGLVVTADVHRRSAVVKRKVVKKSLVTKTSKKKHTDELIEVLENQSAHFLSRNKNKLAHIPSRKRTKLKTALTVSSRELTLTPGSYVEVVETVVHGGRVRGNIIWEEEAVVELDDELLAQIKMPRGAGDNEGDHAAGIESNSKKKSFFKRKNSQQCKNPFSSDLFAESPYQQESPIRKEPSLSPLPLTTVKYNGWISLHWAGNNRERDEAAVKQRNGGTLMADEDSGPWTQPVSIGVYRIQGDRTGRYVHSESTPLSQLSLSDSPDDDRNITQILVNEECVEIVETQIVVMKTKISNAGSNNQRVGMNGSDGVCGVRTVRARCIAPILIPPMIPEHVDGMRCVNAQPQKKFTSGWISLSTDNVAVGANASPLPLGAYVVVASSGCAVTEGNRTDSKIKSILPCKSCVDVVATRMEFEENETAITCHCGRESIYSVVAVRALIATGGHLTLFAFPIRTTGSVDNVCYCGQLAQHTFCQPVPLGKYIVTHPGGIIVTNAVGTESPTISNIAEGASVTVLQTGVEDGCVRGKIRIEVNDLTNESVTGWISLFGFPEKKWAEYVYEKC